VSDTLEILVWLTAGFPVMILAAFLGTRLLGVRRSWLNIAVAGLVGYTIGALLALWGADGDLQDPGLVRDTLALALIATMVVAIGIDMLAKPGTLPRGDEIGRISIPHPVRRTRRALRPVSRYREIVAIARHNGFGRALGHRGRSTGQDPEVSTGVRLRQTLAECGGMFVKLGQVASTRSDLLPPEITSELAKLQSDAPAAPRDDIQALIESEIGRPVDEVFASFEWEPIAAASIAQAHAATLPNGDEVVVKVQRPRIEELVELDTQVLLQLATTVQERTVYGAHYDIVGLAREFTRSLYEELDFDREARNAAVVAGNVADDPDSRDLIVIPSVYDDLTTRRLMVQQRLPGRPLGDGTVLDEFGADRHLLADRLMASFLRQMMIDGFFHADPHPGNVFVLPDGRLGLIDFGATGLLDPITREALQQMVLAVTSRDARRLREAVGTVTDISAQTDEDALDRALARYMSEHVQPGAGIDARAINDLVPLFGQFGIALPTGLTVFGRTLVTLEGTLSVIAPTYSIADAIQRIAQEWVTEAMTPEALQEQALVELAAQAPTLRRLPGRVDNITNQMAKGQFTIRTRLFSEQEDIDAIGRLANRGVMAFVGAVISALSVVLIVTDAGPEFAGEATLLNTIGYLGLFAGVVLLMRVTAQILREGLN
jgi:ubiquinone biosynthesis protein